MGKDNPRACGGKDNRRAESHRQQRAVGQGRQGREDVGDEDVEFAVTVVAVVGDGGAEGRGQFQDDGVGDAVLIGVCLIEV